MTIRVERPEQDSGPAIVLDQHFDFESVGSFRQCYETLVNTEEGVVAIDFRNTRFIDSSALGMLINARSFFEEKNIDVVLINPCESVRKIFNISRFDKKFEIR